MQTSIETTATVGANRHLILDEEIPAQISKKVRVIVMLDEDIDELEWAALAAANEVFRLLDDEEEDIYSPEDGNPITDEA